MNGGEKKGKIFFKLTDFEDDGILKVEVDGEIILKSSERTVQISEKELIFSTSNEKGEIKNYLKISNGEKYFLNYKDEKENEINIVDEEINIKSKNIKHNEGEYSMVLGEKLIDVLKDLIGAITAITVTTPVGPSGTPINSAQFTSIKSDLDKIKSKISKLN